MSEPIKVIVPESMVERGLRQAVEKLVEADRQASEYRDLLEAAFGLIANVDGFTDADGGSWPQQSDEWRGAARAFCDRYHNMLSDIYGEGDPPTEAEPVLPESARLIAEAEENLAAIIAAGGGITLPQRGLYIVANLYDDDDADLTRRRLATLIAVAQTIVREWDGWEDWTAGVGHLDSIESTHVGHLLDVIRLTPRPAPEGEAWIDWLRVGPYALAWLKHLCGEA